MSAPPRGPAVSVVIPTHGRPERLRDCLLALTRQDYPRERWEVVVVDDASPEPAPVAAAVEAVRDQMNVCFVRQPHGGPAKARNTGASSARFDHLAFTDDDCWPRSTWLTELAAAFDREPDTALGGRVVNGVEENLYSEASQRLVDYVVQYFLETGRPFFPSNNIALSRAAFDAVGGFDERFPLAAGEDRDFFAKCREAGIRLGFAADAVVEHRHVLSLRGFVRQHFNYGRGAFLCRTLEAERGAGELHVEPLRFYVDLVRSPYTTARPSGGRLRLAGLLCVSQAANAAGFFAERFGIGDGSARR